MYLRIVTFICCVVWMSRGTDACMCMPSHPQEQLCQKDSFAALVKIRSKEYVYTVPRSKLPRKAGIHVLGDDASKIPFVELSKDEPTFIPDYKGYAKGHHVSAPEEMDRVEIVVKDLGHLPPKYYMSSHVRYRVKVYETYKGLKAEEVQGKKMYIYTAPDEGLCGIELATKEMYMIIGDMEGDRLNVGLCNHLIVWNSLDVKQKRNIRRNLRDSKKTCESSCEVMTCTWSGCPKSEGNTCTWTYEMDRNNKKLDVQPANYMCKPIYGKQGETCGWTDSLKTSKRRRRRRRHHFSAGFRSLPVDVIPSAP